MTQFHFVVEDGGGLATAGAKCTAQDCASVREIAQALGAQLGIVDLKVRAPGRLGRADTPPPPDRD